jgi:hypothetical protein
MFSNYVQAYDPIWSEIYAEMFFAIHFALPGLGSSFPRQSMPNIALTNRTFEHKISWQPNPDGGKAGHPRA